MNMKKLALILISMLALQIAFAVSEQATEQESFKFDSTRMALIINADKPEIPPPFKNFIGDERINVYVDEQVLGLIITDGSVQEARDSALPDPTIVIRTTQKTIDDLYSNKIKPSEALKTKAIEIKGIGAWNGLKVGFLKIGLRIISGKLDKLVEEKENQNKEANKEEAKEKANETVDCNDTYSISGNCSKGTCSGGACK